MATMATIRFKATRIESDVDGSFLANTKSSSHYKFFAQAVTGEAFGINDREVLLQAIGNKVF